MPNIYLISKRKNIVNLKTTSSWGIVKWNSKKQHSIKFFIKKTEFLDQSYNKKKDYTTFYIEWEMFNYYVPLNQSYALHFIGDQTIKNFFGIPCSRKRQQKIQLQSNVLYQNTDPFLFSKEWYYGICMKNIRYQTPRLQQNDIVIFGHCNNSFLEIYCLFIVDNKASISISNYKKLPFLMVYSNLKTRRNGRSKFFHVPLHTAIKYHQKNNSRYFSYVPGKINNNFSSINLHQPATINLNNYYQKYKKFIKSTCKNSQNYQYLARNLPLYIIQQIYDDIKNDILNQGFVLIVDF